ncbi:MAG: sel1 repeat family protein, partial [Clostridia bacterium]|nr:sel1 repeat family protein [Clostridia bacterium]
EDLDKDNPLNWLQAEARNGNIYAMYRLARLYLDENNRFYNENIGDYYLEKAAKADHSVAQYRMGKMFYYGIIYREDEYEAQKWLSESVGNGNKYADALLGKLYVESDLFGEFRNEGFDHLFNAERNGSEFAAYTLGKYYMEGKHVKKDIAKAIEHLEIASARGNMYADYRLAQIYLFEADIFDMEKALEYLNRSAHAGNESAALALTRMANNQFLAVATNVLDLVGSLASIESYRQPQDCTTMPISRKERKKHEWEQSM